MTTALADPCPAAYGRTAVCAPPARGRGRPAALTDPEHIQSLLTDITRGATVAGAAAALGLSRTPVYRLRSLDPLFAASLTLAQAAGKAARRQATAGQLLVDRHGTEARYTKRHCTCVRCRRAASRARARRRAATASDITNSAAAADRTPGAR